MKKRLGVATVVLLMCACDCSDDPAPAADAGQDASIADSSVDGGGSDAGSDGSIDAGSLLDGSNDDGAIVVSDSGVTVNPDGGEPYTCFPVTCSGRRTQCGDCVDNDGDNLTDSQDPECLGPCDNTEGPILLAGVGGESGGPCKSDCYFDFGNGPGNDQCRWDHRCDPLSVAPNYDPEGMTCEYEPSRVGTRDCPASQSTTCNDFCRPITPNGCDCFGCCTFDALAGRSQAAGGEWVWIGSVLEGTNTGTCTLDEVTDTSKCRPCTPVANCQNDCGFCELCVGRDSLPPACTQDGGVPDGGFPDGGVPDGGVDRCSPGIQPCGLPGDAQCDAGSFCITGCCVPLI